MGIFSRAKKAMGVSSAAKKMREAGASHGGGEGSRASTPDAAAAMVVAPMPVMPEAIAPAPPSGNESPVPAHAPPRDDTPAGATPVAGAETPFSAAGGRAVPAEEYERLRKHAQALEDEVADISATLASEGKRWTDDMKEMQERLNLENFKFQLLLDMWVLKGLDIEELHAAMPAGAVPPRAPRPAAPAAPRPAPAEPEAGALETRTEWVLREAAHAGKPLLVDDATGKVYADVPDARGSFPTRLVGKLGPGGAVELRAASTSFFERLNEFLIDHRVTLKALFKKVDPDGAGSVERRSAYFSLMRVMPNTKRESCPYLLAQLEADSEGLLTFDGFQEFLLRALQAAEDEAQPGDKNPVLDVLARARQSLGRSGKSVKAVWKTMDPEMSEGLSDADLARLLTTLMPDLDKRDMQHLLAHMSELDAEGTGKVTIDEFNCLMGTLPVRRVRGEKGSAPGPSAPAEDDDWSLTEIYHDGTTYLWDEKSNKIYADVPDGSFPSKVVGQMVTEDGEQRVRIKSESDNFFVQLDQYLTSRDEGLEELLQRYDANSSGDLDQAEAHKMLTEIMPKASKRSKKFLLAHLGVSGKGQTLSLEALEDLIYSGVDAARSVGSDKDPKRVVALCEKARTILRLNKKPPEAMFHRYDEDGDGRLSGAELTQFVDDVFPGLKRKEVQELIAHLDEWDIDGDGSISLPEFNKAMGAVPFARVQ